MPHNADATHLLDVIVDKAHVGIFVVDRSMKIQLWNNFMEMHSGKMADEIIGSNLFESFPELPRKWLESKINSVFVLKNYAFSSWKQRPFLFQFAHNRPVTGGVETMHQDCTMLPVKDESGEVRYVCFTLFDVTDVSFYQQMLHEANQKLKEASNRDALTGLYNRRFSEDYLIKEFERYKRYDTQLSVILVDVDHFKNINDTYGHLAGDEVLRNVSQRLSEGLRKPDVLGRYGGEEFLIILPETNQAGARIVAERLRQHIGETPIQVEAHQLSVSASLGVCQTHPEIKSHEALIAKADKALYHSKETGRNQVTVFGSTLKKAG